MELFLVIYILINIFTFLLMRVDKKRAINRQWRVAEVYLWGTAIGGGALGAWIGMRTFRHKTKHFTFKYGLPLLTIIQLILIGYFVSGLT
ncbi:DUF1294 domain-containing protein [Sutcliffiella halmapala]|uniref:DUF1294 domain-containing protein n=1 Tax=Sutcliffiella halmapala TaxID=79882 RepID=UPI00099537A1|nr:DUF1294 domain-containing protein [Sutcliffiella halmapala]